MHANQVYYSLHVYLLGCSREPLLCTSAPVEVRKFTMVVFFVF